jgi:hypothetical protein
MAEKYQVFISFKNEDEDGIRTKDSILAEKIYSFLSKKGIKVFHSNFSLAESGTGIFIKTINDALESSDVLIAVGTSKENFESSWVRQEWESFLNLMLSGAKSDRRIFVYTDDKDLSKIPVILQRFDAFCHIDNPLEKLYSYIKQGEHKSKNKKEIKIMKERPFCLYRISGKGPDLITIPPTKKISIGKKSENDIVLNESKVSRFHAELFYRGGSLYVRDFGSKNGTFVNSEILTKNQGEKELFLDDIVAFANVFYKVSFPAKDEETITSDLIKKENNI